MSAPLPLALLVLFAGQAAEPSLGDPRFRGGARDLFPEEEGDAAESPPTRAFTLYGEADAQLGPLALAPEGRFAAFSIERGGRWRIAVVDTASATLRALGPLLDEAPAALALTDRELIVATGSSLWIQPWYAAATRADASSRPDEGAAERVELPLEGAGPPALVVDEAGERLAVSLPGGAGAAATLAVLDLDPAALADGWPPERSIEPEGLSSCPALSFGAKGLVLLAACRGEPGHALLRAAIDDDRARAGAPLALALPEGAILTGVSARGGSEAVLVFARDDKGILAQRKLDGSAGKEIALSFAPQAVVAREQGAVVASSAGGAWLVGLDGGGTLIGLDAPDLTTGSGLSRAVISADGGTALVGGDARHPELERPTLWVVPALR